MSTALRLGTRASALAMTQSRQVADALSAATGADVELVEVTTEGDVTQGALADLGGRGVFVGALRDALLSGLVDFAVHSLKDLPTEPAPGITLAAVPPREDPRDALVARDGLTLGELPSGARVATGSPRRAAQIHALGLGVEIVGIRGNVETRLRRVDEGSVDAVLLARAGLARLGLIDRASEVLDPLQMLPAPGQGALAVECRDSDSKLAELLRSALDDSASRTAVTAERALLNALGGGCSAPVGALAEIALGEESEEVWLRAVAADVDGSRTVRLSATGAPDDPVGLGRRLADQMLAEGARDLIEERVL